MKGDRGLNVQVLKLKILVGESHVLYVVLFYVPPHGPPGNSTLPNLNSPYQKAGGNEVDMGGRVIINVVEHTRHAKQVSFKYYLKSPTPTPNLTFIDCIMVITAKVTNVSNT